MTAKPCPLCRLPHVLPKCERCGDDIADPHQLRPTCAECAWLERNERLATPGRRPDPSEPPTRRTEPAGPHQEKG
jgi:hypothetical protein